MSLGVAELKKGENGNDWLHRADEALYRAKDAGRNSTSISD
ncbi:MAG: GGDEF domain-containing protein [Gammaproteobacteria bacterium]|nr:GGDEF domain-containing protein [Gammaproteobacteria bacterium]